MINLRGEVEIIGKENGKVIYYDKGPNMITYWGRHAVMHLLTGDVFGKNGRKRDVLGHSSSVNPDGTLISGQQFFHNNSDPNYDANFYWSKSTLANHDYPFMPVKMLLGTGLEYKEYSDFISGVDEWGGNDYLFNDNITNNAINSNYSNFLNGKDNFPTQARTVNSENTKIKTEPLISQTDTAISGAIKDGGYGSDSEKTAKTEENQTFGRILKPELRGIGRPCFIYPLRGNSTFENETSQVMLTKETVDQSGENIENKITFTVVLPEQTGNNSDLFYPYNGYTIKEIGLFSDAYLYTENNSTVYDKRMPYGLLFAKRYVAQFTKTANSSFTIRWTIYI